MTLEVAVEKTFKGFKLCVQFAHDNDIMGVLGASGSGKSMTLKCIAGIETPQKGRIVLNGRVLFDSEQKINLKPQERKVGYLFQNYALFPNMTVEENIMSGMGKKPPMDKVREYVERFQLTGLEKRLPSQISGGQKQRVALARMMASQPEILLLDEPLSALDSYLKWQMEEELLEMLSQVHKTVLFVSHSRDEVYHLCHRVCLVNKGRIETIQEKKEFFRNPRTVAAARISGCRNISAARKTGPHELEAADWGMRFVTERDVPDDLAFVGARAHEIKAEYTEKRIPGRMLAEPNKSCMKVEKLLEQQFESELCFNAQRMEKTRCVCLWIKKGRQPMPGKRPLRYLSRTRLFCC